MTKGNLRRRIAWFIPDPIEGSGGHRTIIEHARYATSRGYENTFFVGTETTLSQTKKKFQDYFGEIPGELKIGRYADGIFDIAVATGWWTAADVARHKDIPIKVYFVQDFEAAFNPIGTEYLNAVDSYRYGLYPITIGRWLTNKLKKEFGSRSQYFEFGVDHSIYHNKEHTRDYAIAVLFQADKPRRCTEMLIETMFAIKHYAPDVKIYTYGQDEAPPMSGILHRGLLSRKELSLMYNECSLGICLSATNPSRIPFEMMACGLPVVDLHMENNLYDHVDGAALLASPDPYSVAEAALQILFDTEQQKRRSANALAFVAERTEASECAAFVDGLERIVNGKNIPRKKIEPSYTDKPIVAGKIVEPMISPVRLPTVTEQKEFDIELVVEEMREAAIAKASVASLIVANDSHQLSHAVKETQPQLISCDLWDTLLFRNVHPDEIKLRTSKYLLGRFKTQLRPVYRDAKRLLALRQLMERQIGEANREEEFDDEYEISDVFKHVLENALSDVDEDSLQDAVEHLVQFELDAEVEVTQVDRACEAAIMNETQGRQVIIASDFYMSADMLGELCQRVGLKLEPEVIISSCDIKLNKRNGRMFDYICEEFDVLPEAVLHIGDNPHSDVVSAKSYGFNAFHYSPNSHVKTRKAQAEEWVSRFEGTATPYLAKIEKLDSARVLKSKKEQMKQLGEIFAPVLIGYADFIAHMGRHWQTDQINFFTREGIFFKRVFELRQASLGLEDEFRTETIPISRVASFLPSLDEISLDSMMRVWSQYSTQSITELMRTLHCADVDLAPYLPANLDPDARIRYPWKNPDVQALFSNKDFIATIEERCRTAHAAMTTMLSERNFQFEGQNIIVDIGWRGSIQDNLARCFPKSSVKGIYIALQRFLNEQPERSEKFAFVTDLNSGNNRFADIIDVVRPIEMLCNALGGSVLEYVDNPDGKTIINTRTLEFEDAIFDQFTQHFQAAVFNAIESWPEQTAAERPDIRESMVTAGIILRKILHDPPFILAHADGKLHHNELFGVGAATNSTNVKITDWARAIRNRGIRENIMKQAIESGWPQGFLRRQLFGLPLRWAQYRGRY